MILGLLKTDIGITHDKKDEYLSKLIESTKKTILEKGIPIDETDVKDAMLISSYSAWIYRKRTEDVPLSNNLMRDIRNRIVKERAKNVR